MVDAYADNRRLERMFPGIAEENRARATLSTSELAAWYRQRACNHRNDYDADEDGEVISTIIYDFENEEVRVIHKYEMLRRLVNAINFYREKRLHSPTM